MGRGRVKTIEAEAELRLGEREVVADLFKICLCKLLVFFEIAQ